jgi:hypothetical protein
VPDIRYSVRIVNDHGDGIADERVSVQYDLTHDDAWTDRDRWAAFEKSNLVYSGVTVKIYFKGELMGEEWVEDGATFSFTYR